MNILVTGFEPFQLDRINPSWEVAQALDGLRLNEYRICAIRLPVVFGEAAQVLQQAIQQFKPDYVLCLGVAANRNKISLERVAINIDDARISDNAGNQPIDEIIAPEGPSAFFSTLPIKAIFQRLQQEKIAVGVSNTAGTYVCNHLFYQLMLMIQDTQIKGGFIHVPALPDMIQDNPVIDGIDLNTQIQAIRIVIETTIQNKKDVKVSTGTIS